MSDSLQPTPMRPKITIAVCSFVVGVVTTCVTAGVHYGELRSDLSNGKEKQVELQRKNGDLAIALKSWREAYDAQSTALRKMEARAQKLAQDRCNPIKSDIDDLRRSIDIAEQSSWTERVASLKEMLQDYQITLRTCYSSRTALTGG